MRRALRKLFSTYRATNVVTSCRARSPHIACNRREDGIAARATRWISRENASPSQNGIHPRTDSPLVEDTFVSTMAAPHKLNRKKSAREYRNKCKRRKHLLVLNHPAARDWNKTPADHEGTGPRPGWDHCREENCAGSASRHARSVDSAAA